MRKFIKTCFIVFGFIFICKVNMLCAEINLNVCGRQIDNSGYAELNANDLVDSRVVVNGLVQDAEGTCIVKISLNNGKNWEEIGTQDKFLYEFVPIEGHEYAVLIASFDKEGKMNESSMVVIKYFAEDIRNQFDELFRAIAFEYMDERIQKVLSYFDEASYPAFDSFKDNLSATFDDNSRFSLDIQIRSIRYYNGTVITHVDWNKTFESNELQSGRNNEIHFTRVNGRWKICYIEDDSIFIIGTGLLIFGTK